MFFVPLVTKGLSIALAIELTHIDKRMPCAGNFLSENSLYVLARPAQEGGKIIYIQQWRWALGLWVTSSL